MGDTAAWGGQTDCGREDSRGPFRSGYRRVKQAVVTTVIPTFRRPHLLKRAIASALNQTYEAVAVEVFDNASGDETAAVVAEAASKDPRVRYSATPAISGRFAISSSECARS